MEEYNEIEDVAYEIERKLLGANNNKALTLLYAFNSTGKTRISNIIKDEENKKNICFNSFITDLFVWNNEEITLNIQKNSWVANFIRDQGCENEITNNFQKLVMSKLEPYFDLKEGIVTFNIPTGDEKSINNIKISKGEESLFIWSVFYTIISIAIDELNTDKEKRSTNIFDELQYITIDDPISSVDDSRAITMAMQLIDLIDNSKSNLKFIITTHYALLFNVLYNNYNRLKDKKIKLFKYILRKEENIYYLEEQKEIDLKKIINDEDLNEEETRKFLDNAFRDGQVKTNGTDIEKILPPMRRFGGGNRAEKKENIIVKVKKFFEKYFGLGTADRNDDGFEYRVTDEEESYDLNMVAEDGEKYRLNE